MLRAQFDLSNVTSSRFIRPLVRVRLFVVAAALAFKKETTFFERT
jgi:hypothetical protein